MNINVLEDYKRELIAEHREEIAAIDRLIARERSKTASVNGARQPIQITARPRGRMSLRATVTAVLKKMSGEIDRDMVIQQIQSEYPAFTGTSSQIARELWKRAKAGELKTIQEGRGRIAAIYAKK